MGAPMTPGPWVDAGDGSIESEDGGLIVLVPDYTNIRTAQRWGENFNHANAKAIAALPDLLVALERLRDCKDIHGQEWVDATEAANVAIDKARSKT